MQKKIHYIWKTWRSYSYGYQIGQQERTFDRKKLWAAISRACVKRPVSTETIEKIVSEVESEISDFIMEVPSSVIGQKALNKLMDIDTVAYIRFASVYNNFADINDFMTELKKLKKEHDKSKTKKK